MEKGIRLPSVLLPAFFTSGCDLLMRQQPLPLSVKDQPPVIESFDASP